MPSDGRRLPVEPIEPDALTPIYRTGAPRYRAGPPEAVPDPMYSLLAAFDFLVRRGVGPNAWARSLAENPLAFMLDAMQDGVRVLHGDQGVVYQNRAAEAFPEFRNADSAQGVLVEQDGALLRRRMTYADGNREVTVEVISRRR
jgi:hypothetical protein